MIVLRQKIFFQSRTSGEYFTGADINKSVKELDHQGRLLGMSEEGIKRHRGNAIKNAYALHQVDPINIPLGKTERFDDWVNRKLTAKRKTLDWLENKGVIRKLNDHFWTIPDKPVTTAAKVESKGLAKSGKIIKRAKSLLRK